MDRNVTICIKCVGDGCDQCDKGVISLEGKPQDSLTNSAIDLWTGYKWLKDYGKLPKRGGWADQSIKFIRCVEWVDLINLKFDKYLKKNKKKKKVWANKFNQLMGSKSGKK